MFIAVAPHTLHGIGGMVAAGPPITPRRQRAASQRLTPAQARAARNATTALRKAFTGTRQTGGRK